jgi:hypothetical protein
MPGEILAKLGQKLAGRFEARPERTIEEQQLRGSQPP